MLRIDSAAAYFCFNFHKDFNKPIDEMKLHKLLYFAQKESFIVKNEPLFKDDFYGWMYGPVLKEIRSYYKNDQLLSIENLYLETEYDDTDRSILDHTYTKYSDWDSWSLSRLTHGEISWKNSRVGLKSSEAGNRRISKADIRKDADRLKIRRDYLNRSSNESDR